MEVPTFMSVRVAKTGIEKQDRSVQKDLIGKQ
jgi:hypothetical protein